MLGKTHIVGGAAAFELIAITSGPKLTKEELAVGLVFCIIGALAPDIDHPHSKISKSDILIGALSEAICTFTKHRGIIHTPLGCALLGILTYATVRATVNLANANAAFMLALLVFCILHFGTGASRIKKFGGLISIAVFFEYAKITTIFPDLPTITLPEGYERFIGLCVFAGAISHIILDTFNPEGIMLFYPIRRRIHIANITTGTKPEISFIIILTTIVGCAAIRYSIPYIAAMLSA